MIQSPLLPHFQAHLAGQWTSAHSRGSFAVLNPANGEVLAELPDGGPEQAHAACAAAAAITTPPTLAQRKRALQEIARRILSHKAELGRIIALENGKPLKEGVGEAEYSAGFFAFYADAVDHLEPTELSQRPRNCRWTVHYRPAGVAAIITPWNFPLAMMAKKIAPALAAGCSLVTKPARQTPLSAIAFWQLAADLFPPGMLNLVLGSSARPIAQVLCSHPAVRILSFTGSTAVGKDLAASAAPHLKRLALELGGNAPFLVFADANLEQAADALIANKFRAGGQTCVCTNRVYVQASVEQAFLEKVQARVARLRVGDGTQEGTDLGPLIDRSGWDKVAQHVHDALARGARLLTGGPGPRPAEDYAAFFPPTLLAGVSEEMLVCREETFGPVVAVSTFTDEAQAVAAANGTEYGLAGYVFTGDEQRAQRVIAELHFGHIGLNTGTGPTPEAPFGGMKQSGYGREGGVEGLLEFTEPQTVAAG